MRYYNRTFLFFSVLLLFVNCFGQQKKVNFSYKFDVLPNYNKYLLDDISKELNNGVVNNLFGSFFKSSKTLGWNAVDKVVLDITLSESRIINNIRIHTIAKEKSGVKLPRYMYLFSTEDNKHFKLEAFKDFSKLNDSKDGLYWLEIDNFRSDRKKFKLVIIPSYNYFFVDEIEISFDSKNIDRSSLKEDDTEAFYDLSDDIDDVLNKIIISTRPSIKKYDLDFKKKNSDNIIVTRRKPFGFCHDEFLDSNNEMSVNQQLIGGSYYYSFSIDNLTGKSKSIDLDLDFNFNCDIELYEVVGVTNNQFVDCGDMLKSLNQSFLLESNDTKNLYVKVTFNDFTNSGIGKISFKADKKIVSIDKEVFSVTKNNQKRINVINWAYLDYPQLEQVQDQAIDDLLKHNVNTFVLHRGYLNVNSFDFTHTINYIKKLKLDSSSKLLLFFNFALDKNRLIRDGKKIEYLSNDWFKFFVEWYSELLVVLNKEGIENVYFYPYDELKIKDLNDFQVLNVELQKKIKNHIKIFVTIDNLKSLETVGFVDIIQIHKRLLNADNLKLIKSKEIWLYDIFYYGRDVSPQEYYNLGELAFKYNLQGIGFWNYSRYLKQEVKATDFSYSRNTYSVIYNNKDKIYSSKRWEAFLAGLTEYYVKSISIN